MFESCSMVRLIVQCRPWLLFGTGQRHTSRTCSVEERILKHKIILMQNILSKRHSNAECSVEETF